MSCPKLDTRTCCTRAGHRLPSASPPGCTACPRRRAAGSLDKVIQRAASLRAEPTSRAHRLEVILDGLQITCLQEGRQHLSAAWQEHVRERRREGAALVDMRAAEALREGQTAADLPRRTEEILRRVAPRARLDRGAMQDVCDGDRVLRRTGVVHAG